MGIAGSAPYNCVFLWSGIYLYIDNVVVSLLFARGVLKGRARLWVGSVGDHQFRRRSRMPATRLFRAFGHY